MLLKDGLDKVHDSMGNNLSMYAQIVYAKVLFIIFLNIRYTSDGLKK